MIRTATLATCLALFGVPASAQSTQQIDNLDAALLNGWQTDNGSHMAALQLSLAPGWKTYWRSPGEAGLPPLFNWSGSENVQSVRIYWPTPSVFHTNGMQSIGYHDGVVFPLEVTAVDPTKPMHLRAQVDLGICREVCLPATIDLSTDLTGPGAPDHAINAALAARPENAAKAGLASIHCAVDPIADGLRITATIEMPSIGTTETVAFEAGQPDIWVAQATTTRSGNQLVSFTEMVAPSGAPFALDRSKVVLTVIADGQAVEIRGCPAS
jgi:DsbC/DsbD-like thiol-disulfide interchange protein